MERNQEFLLELSVHLLQTPMDPFIQSDTRRSGDAAAHLRPQQSLLFIELVRCQLAEQPSENRAWDSRSVPTFSRRERESALASASLTQIPSAARAMSFWA